MCEGKGHHTEHSIKPNEKTTYHTAGSFTATQLPKENVSTIVHKNT